MSFGGWASAAALEIADDRVKCAVMQCPALAKCGPVKLHSGKRQEKRKPVMLQLGTEDTVIGEEGNEACRQYAATHEGPAYVLEILRGGHVSFTSCELYNSEYGNGIGSSSKSLTKPGTQYVPLDIVEQHRIINTCGLAFLNAYLKGGKAAAAFLHADAAVAFDKGEVKFSLYN